MLYVRSLEPFQGWLACPRVMHTTAHMLVATCRLKVRLLQDRQMSAVHITGACLLQCAILYKLYMLCTTHYAQVPLIGAGKGWHSSLAHYHNLEAAEAH